MLARVVSRAEMPVWELSTPAEARMLLILELVAISEALSWQGSLAFKLEEAEEEGGGRPEGCRRRS